MRLAAFLVVGQGRLHKFGMTAPGINDIIKRKLENKEVPHAT